MLKYFRELLATLKSIDATNKQIEAHLATLAGTVRRPTRTHGHPSAVTTMHWNGG